MSCITIRELQIERAKKIMRIRWSGKVEGLGVHIAYANTMKDLYYELVQRKIISKKPCDPFTPPLTEEEIRLLIISETQNVCEDANEAIELAYAACYKEGDRSVSDTIYARSKDEAYGMAMDMVESSLGLEFYESDGSPGDLSEKFLEVVEREWL